LKQTSQGHVRKGHQECVCTSTIAVSRDPLSPSLLTYAVMKTSESTEEDSDDTDQPMKEIFTQNIPLVSSTAQV